MRGLKVAGQVIAADLKPGGDVSENCGERAHLEWIVSRDRDVMLAACASEREADVAANLPRHPVAALREGPNQVIAGDVPGGVSNGKDLIPDEV